MRAEAREAGALLGALRLAAERKAQATVEMAIVVPVLVALAIIAYNLMLYSSAVARFDRVAPDIVIAHISSPATGEGHSRDSARATAELELARAMGDLPVEVDISPEETEGAGDSIFRLVGSPGAYRCSMLFRPWPSRFSIAGISLSVPFGLHHERRVVVDSWRPGVVM